MRNTIKIFLFIFLVISFSCEEQGLFVDCPECMADEPFEAQLEIRLEFNYYNETQINIYEGNLEDSILIGTFFTSSDKFRHNVRLNKKYTVTATYLIVNDRYIAVDSAFPRVRYTKDQCKDPCFFVYDRICNLRLKYTK